MALVVTVGLRAVIAKPAALANALVGSNALSMTRARLAGEQSIGSSIADGDGALGSLVSLPAAANSIEAVSTLGAVAWAVARLAIKACEALVAVASEGSNAKSMSRAVMRAGRFIAVFALVSIGTIGAVKSCKVSSAVANTR